MAKKSILLIHFFWVDIHRYHTLFLILWMDDSERVERNNVINSQYYILTTSQTNNKAARPSRGKTMARFITSLRVNTALILHSIQVTCWILLPWVSCRESELSMWTGVFVWCSWVEVMQYQCVWVWMSWRALLCWLQKGHCHTLD